MKRLFLLGIGLTLLLSLTACKNEKDSAATESPVTGKPTEAVITDIPKETEAVIITKEPVSETEAADTQNAVSATEVPLDFQKEGWISSDDAITLLKMYLGSYDDAGNEFSFGHESTVFKDGKYYYNFRITTLIVSETGLAHQSYFGNYLVSTDGNDIIENTTE